MNEKLLWISFSLPFSFQNFELGPLSLTQTHTKTHTHTWSSPDTFMCPTFYSGGWSTKTSFSLHFRFSKPLILSYDGKLCHCNPNKHINLCKHWAFLMIMRLKSEFSSEFPDSPPSRPSPGLLENLEKILWKSHANSSREIRHQKLMSCARLFHRFFRLFSAWCHRGDARIKIDD